jgi:hypothetical protein
MFMIASGGSSSHSTLLDCFFASITSKSVSVNDVINPSTTDLSSLHDLYRWGGSTVAACASGAAAMIADDEQRDEQTTHIVIIGRAGLI